MTTHAFKPEEFPVLLDWPVQWGDQDLFGHVNNTVYFRWFESSRVEYLNKLGQGKMHEERQIGPILAHVDCNFRRQINYPDTVRLGSRVERIGRTSFKIQHAIWSTTQELQLSADGSSTVVMFDYQAQRPIPIPAEIRALIEVLEGRRFE
jgi:acyl-CoA thioester hydrolase